MRAWYEAARLPSVSHPTLGMPPRDLTAGHPDAAARLTRERDALAARALEIAVGADPSIPERYDEIGRRRLLNDAAVHLDRLIVAVASGDAQSFAHWADMCVAPYRRRRVPMDDLVALAEGLRRATEGILSQDERAVADEALDGAVLAWRKARRLGGDARKRNPILNAIYKGA